MVLVEDPQVQLVRPPLLVGLCLAGGEGTPLGRLVGLSVMASPEFFLDGWLLAGQIRIGHRCSGTTGWMGSGAGGLAVGAEAPVDDLGLVHIELPVLRGREARGVADGAVDVDEPVAALAHEMVVVVADAVLVAVGEPAGWMRRMMPCSVSSVRVS